MEKGRRDPLDRPERTKMYYETLTAKLRELHKDGEPIMIIPVGHASYILDQKIKAGMVPGISSIFEFASDHTHYNNFGAYVAGCGFYSVIYRESPVGLPHDVPDYQAKAGARSGGVIDERFARIIQQSVWEAVASHPWSGVSVDEPVKVLSPLVENALTGDAYVFDLLAAFGKPPYRWSLASGALPEGVALSTSGRLSGSPKAPGTFPVRFKVQDAGGGSAEKDLTIVVELDVSPGITTESLPPASQAEFYSQQLESKPGNGPLTWSLESGSLPPGMLLTGGGKLDEPFWQPACAPLPAP
jgi:hypothetical protein